MEQGQAEEVGVGAGTAMQQLPKVAAEAGAPSDAAMLGSCYVCRPCNRQMTDTLKQVPIELVTSKSVVYAVPSHIG